VLSPGTMMVRSCAIHRAWSGVDAWGTCDTIIQAEAAVTHGAECEVVLISRPGAGQPVLSSEEMPHRTCLDYDAWHQWQTRSRDVFFLSTLVLATYLYSARSIATVCTATAKVDHGVVRNEGVGSCAVIDGAAPSPCCGNKWLHRAACGCLLCPWERAHSHSVAGWKQHWTSALLHGGAAATNLCVQVGAYSHR
jgi:hypothetical protein